MAADGRMPHGPGAGAQRVLVVGGGVAGIEALLGLHDLGAGELTLELVSASGTAKLCPQLVGRAWGEPPIELDLEMLCDELGAELHEGELTTVDQATRTALLADGHELGYDALLIACGGRAVAPYAGIRTLGRGARSEAYARLRPGRFSIVVPPGAAWTLPAYQLALLAAGDLTVPVEVITAERHPLELFDRGAAAVVTDLLEHAGVNVLPRCVVPLDSDLFTLLDNVVALPLLRGPAIVGLPADVDGFLPVDGHGRVVGTTGVHGAGDATSRALKHGGLAAQDGGVAAADIARGQETSSVSDAPPRVIRGVLVASDERTVYLRRALDGQDAGVASRTPLWNAHGATDAWRLTSWLKRRSGARLLH
jgi:sulfide:quinone oxidoreductase